MLNSTGSRYIHQSYFRTPYTVMAINSDRVSAYIKLSVGEIDRPYDTVLHFPLKWQIF